MKRGAEIKGTALLMFVRFGLCFGGGGLKFDRGLNSGLCYSSIY